LQLLLFVDRRPSSSQHIRQIYSYLESLRADFDFDLQVIDIGDQPYLAEYFKLVASPALIKIYPEPRHILAGSNIIAQLESCWPRWQQSIREQPVASNPGTPISEAVAQLYATDSAPPETSQDHPIVPAMPDQNGHTPHRKPVAYSVERLQLSDQIFQLKQETEELQKQLQFKDRIIAMLAHDLRNPLTAVALALETLELGLSPKEGRDSRLSPELILQLLKHARTQTRAIDRLVTDILQGAREKSADLRIQPQELELSHLCQEVLSRCQAQIQSKQQRLSTDLPKDLPHVYADGERVRQVLMNLLDNAIKYTPEGGTIQVSILHRTTQKVQVSICDNGPGVPEENRLSIFEDHFRLQRDEAKAGYGIGLSLCQQIVRSHYGQIWVDSVPGQGSCFHFTLPVYRFS
jgi:two-component system clock-associated histidine kinase SasA